jgi:hypothetical protein
MARFSGFRDRCAADNATPASPPIERSDYADLCARCGRRCLASKRSDGAPRGYLAARLPNGDQASCSGKCRATFVPGPDGKPKLLDNGVWRFIGGTGGLAGIAGAGTMHITAVSPTDREFQLQGEVVVSSK